MFAAQETPYDSLMDWENFATMENMLWKERTTYVQEDYFARSVSITPGSNDKPVDRACRRVMTKWCISVCKFCCYDREMVASVMSCVDRFVATPTGSRILQDRRQYELVVLTALYLVAKTHQTQALEPGTVAQLSRGKFTSSDVEAMELEMLMSLKWLVHPPTPMGYVLELMRNFDFVSEEGTDCYTEESTSDETSSSSSSSSSAIMIETMIIALVNCQFEQAVCDYELGCLTRPSQIAFAAFSNALRSLDIDSTDLDTLGMLLNERAHVIDDEGDGRAIPIGYSVRTTRAALLQAVSSSDTSNKSLRRMLLSQQRKRKAEDPFADSFFQSTASSTFAPPSPRGVTEGIFSCRSGKIC